MAARRCCGSLREDPNFGSLYDLFATTFREPWVVQRFLPQVSEGDKRIILVDGEAAGAVNRVPAANDIRSNMVRGGAAQPTDLTAREREICETIGPELTPPRPHLRRHRRDRRQPHRDQRHLADRHPRDQDARRAGPRRRDLGCDRGPGWFMSGGRHGREPPPHPVAAGFSGISASSISRARTAAGRALMRFT